MRKKGRIVFSPTQSSRGHKIMYSNQEDLKMLITRYFLSEIVLKIKLNKVLCLIMGLD